MNGFLSAGLIMLLFIGLLALFTKAYAAFWYKILVNDKFEIINLLMTTGEVPRKWKIKPLHTLVMKKEGLLPWSVIDSFLVHWAIFKLHRLISFIKHNSLINEVDKIEFLDAFKEIEGNWRSRLMQRRHTK